MLSDRTLRSLREHGEPRLWEYATILFRMQGIILEMEKAERDPDVVQDLATRAIDLVKELDAILAILGDALDD